MTTFKGFVTNCKIEGGIFSGAVDGSCQIEDSAKVTVDFDTKGVGTFPQQKVLRGQKAQDPGVPVQDGYAFDGWYVSGNPNPKWDFSDRVTDNLNLEAHWNKVYQVTLQTNGGTIAAGREIKSYTEGTTSTLPGAGDIIRKGYTFEGWYTDSGFSGVPVTEISSTDTGDKTFYAKWKQNIAPVTPAQTEHNDANHDNTNHDNTNHDNTGDTNESGGTPPAIYPALTFDTCGGSSIKAVRAFEGHMINLSGYQPTREGYEFSGWYADRNLTQPITEIRLNGNRTVYAGWIKQAEQTGENYKKKAAPAQLIADNSEKAANKDSGQYLIEDYEPGATDTPEDMEDQSTEDQATEDQTTGDQRTEDAGDDQKSTVENNPADNSPVDNDSKQDDSANLTSEDSSHSGGWIPVICISAGALVIGPLLYLGFRKWKKIDRK